MNKKAIIPCYYSISKNIVISLEKFMLLQYIIRKIHVIPICENIIISFEKFHVIQYMRKYDHHKLKIHIALI